MRNMTIGEAEERGVVLAFEEWNAQVSSEDGVIRGDGDRYRRRLYKYWVEKMGLIQKARTAAGKKREQRIQKQKRLKEKYARKYAQKSAFAEWLHAQHFAGSRWEEVAEQASYGPLHCGIDYPVTDGLSVWAKYFEAIAEIVPYCGDWESELAEAYRSFHEGQVFKRARASGASERSKMSKRVRWFILERDNFRCRACGATADDAKLHVDHIVPVSKGGRTEESNLQVLCAECNLGKFDRMPS